MALYISPERKQLLEANRLGSIDDVWALRAEWFEEPNVRRGGWSGVCRLALPLSGGSELGVFLKRQENHQRRCWRHPLRGEPTFAREFRMLRYLQAHAVPAPLPVFFASARVDGNSRGILMTEELAGYRPLDLIVAEMFAGGRPPLAAQHRLLRAVARVVRRLHDAGVQHSSLYPKHLFVRLHDDADPEVALIDLEKSRRTLLAERRTVHDLDALNRHSPHWSRSARLYFLLQYLGLPRLDAEAKRLCRRLAGRAGGKRR
ncbi:MAG TPA: lipopolysaccharide kinase InaA family protein [Azospira sp.]|nr:lipopolysaccharide kinase InaA family protein [Azospira sp.]